MKTPLTILTAARECGECTACCSVLGVLEEGKPYYTDCRFLKKGCSVYPDRPPSCQEFKCEWLKGDIQFPADYRPDRCGVVITGATEEDVSWLDLYETRPGAVNGDWSEFIRGVLLHNPFLRGVRIIQFKQKVGTSYQLSKDYPHQDEGEQDRLFVELYKVGDQLVLGLYAPKRGEDE